MNKMNFRIWFENKELVTLNEDYKTALEKFVKANPHANREAVRKYIDEFKTIVTKKYKQIYDPLPSVSVPTNKRNNIDAYPTFEELEAVVDHVKGQVDFSGKVNFKDVEVDAKPVFENESIVIYHADSPRACIKYKGNIPYGWCVARNDASNLYHAYRFKQNEPSFYFVKNKKKTQEEFKLWNLVKTSFEGRFKDPYHFFVIQVIKGADPKDAERKQYVVTSANNDGDNPMSWREITAIDNSLSGLEEVFKNVALSQEERQDHKEFSGGISDEKFAKLPYERKNRYMDIYVRLDRGLTDKQFASLPEDLKNKYIGFGVGLTDKQYELIKGTKLERRYVEVTLEKIKNMAGRSDTPLKLTNSEKSIMLTRPGIVDLSSISTENIIHLLDGMKKKVRAWVDEYGEEHEDEDEEWEGEYEEIKPNYHIRPEFRNEDQKIAEMIISSKKDLSPEDINALIRHAPSPEKIIKMLGNRVSVLDKETLHSIWNSTHNPAASDEIFKNHANLDASSLARILATTKDKENVILGVINSHLDKPLGSLTFDLVTKSSDPEKTLDILLKKKGVFSGIYPGDVGKFYFGQFSGDFFNKLRGEKRQKLAERIAEDNKEELLNWTTTRHGHNPIASLFLMASQKRRILDILGEKILEKIPEQDADMVLRLSEPGASDEFADIHANLSHKNMVSLLISAKDKKKALEKIDANELRPHEISQIMDSDRLDEEQKTMVADKIANDKKEFKWDRGENWTYVLKLIKHAPDKLSAAKKIVSKADDYLSYLFGDLKLDSDDLQKLIEFTLKNIKLKNFDFLSIFAFAPDKQGVIDAVGEERVKEAVRSKAFHSKSGPPLKDVYDKYKE